MCVSTGKFAANAVLLMLLVGGMVGCIPWRGAHTLAKADPFAAARENAGTTNQFTAASLAAKGPPSVMPPNGNVTIAVNSQYGGGEKLTLPLVPGMTVQQALEQADLPRRFKRGMQINVMRVTPYSNGRPVPLKAKYDTVKKRVDVLHDMVLHPGDHVVIAEGEGPQDARGVHAILNRFGMTPK